MSRIRMLMLIVVVAKKAGAAFQSEAAPHSPRKLLGLIENATLLDHQVI